MSAGELIAVFISTHETLRAERAFRKAGIRVRATVKPRKIGSNCQMAITFPEERLEDVMNIVKEGGFDLIGFYRKAGGGDWAEVENNS